MDGRSRADAREFSSEGRYSGWAGIYLILAAFVLPIAWILIRVGTAFLGGEDPEELRRLYFFTIPPFLLFALLVLARVRRWSLWIIGPLSLLLFAEAVVLLFY